MKMVAAARLRRAEDRAKAARPYAERLQSFLDSFTIDPENLPHPLAEVRRTINHKGLLVITSDRGLCGSYNSNILREAVRWIKSQEQDKVRLYIVGNKGVSYFKHRGVPIARQFTNLDQKLDYKETKNIADIVASDFMSGAVDDVDMLYSQFVSPAVCRQIKMHLLPICAAKKEGEVRDKKEMLADFIYEPSPEAILNILFPKYLYTRIVASLADSFASEQGQRMVAMTTATDNAEEMVKALTLKYNKVRQAAITKELGEIVGGAEALEK
jgi:F-type H+-transporting ATPase subunit gamma